MKEKSRGGRPPLLANKLKQVNTSLSKEQISALKKKANKNNVSMSTYIRQLIAADLGVYSHDIK